MTKCSYSNCKSEATNIIHDKEGEVYGSLCLYHAQEVNKFFNTLV